jgi:hypothetical protein
MKTNVILELDDELLREAGLVTDRLETIVRERKAFDKARHRALDRLKQGLDLQWTPPASRDELHKR